MVKSKKLIIFIPSIEDGGVEKNLYLIWAKDKLLYAMTRRVMVINDETHITV